MAWPFLRQKCRCKSGRFRERFAGLIPHFSVHFSNGNAISGIVNCRRQIVRERQLSESIVKRAPTRHRAWHGNQKMLFDGICFVKPFAASAEMFIAAGAQPPEFNP